MSKQYQKEGSGLGLNLAESIIEEHKGSIGYQSGEEGTTFWIRLPLLLS